LVSPRGFQPGHDASRGFAASFDQVAVLLLIEGRQMNGDFRDQVDGRNFPISRGDSQAGAHCAASYHFYSAKARLAMKRVTTSSVTDLSLDQPMWLPLPGTEYRKYREPDY
jgi:hypothetical protein